MGLGGGGIPGVVALPLEGQRKVRLYFINFVTHSCSITVTKGILEGGEPGGGLCCGRAAPACGKGPSQGGGNCPFLLVHEVDFTDGFNSMLTFILTYSAKLQYA